MKRLLIELFCSMCMVVTAAEIKVDWHEERTFNGQNELMIPCTWSVGRHDSFTIALNYRQDERNENGNYFSELLSRGSFQKGIMIIGATNQFATPVFVASRNEQGKYRRYHNIVALQEPALKTWHQIHLVRDGKQGMLRFYYDGKLVQEAVDKCPEVFITDHAPLILGRQFKGRIRSLTMWDGVIPKIPATVRSTAPQAMMRIDPDIANSWKTLQKEEINLIPAPKKITLQGKRFHFKRDEWTVVRCGKEDDPGYQIFCQKAGAPQQGSRIITTSLNPKLKRQGYSIRCSQQKITLTGADWDGLRYAWLTLADLINHEGMMQPADIDDYPNYLERGVSGLYVAPYRKAESMYDEIDRTFRVKCNHMQISGATEFEEQIKWPVNQWKKLNSYARARGIRIYTVIFPKVLDLGKDYRTFIPEGFSSYYYPYKSKQGLLGYMSGAYSWARDDLARNRAEDIADFCRDTGLGGLNIHSIDHGGYENPGNWGMRTEMDRKRWGNDYAAATNNLIGIFADAIQRKSPYTRVLFIPYPYMPTTHQKTLQFYHDLGKSHLKDKVRFVLREGTRDLMKQNRKAFGALPLHLTYYPFLPWEYYPSFSNAGRYLGTWFQTEDDTMMIHLGALLGGMSSPSKVCAAEYMWNPFAPGAANLPENKFDYSVIYESVPVIEEQLLVRAAARLVGPKAAKAFAKIYAYKFTNRLPTYPNNLLPLGTDQKLYFDKMLADVRSAKALYDQTLPDVTPPNNQAAKILRQLLVTTELLTQARLHCIYARQALNREDFKTAQEESEKGKRILAQKHAQSEGLYKIILADLDIAEQINNRLKQKAYLNTVPEQKIRLGFYKYSGTAGISSCIGLLPEALQGAAGMTCGTISNLTRRNLQDFDVIIFNATRDIGDCDEPWRENLQDFVRRGGGIIFTHNACGRFAGGLKKTVFPDICARYHNRLEHDEIRLQSGKTYKHSYYDHYQLIPGKLGHVISRDTQGQAVTIEGNYGSGRVVYTGEIFGINRNDRLIAPSFEEWQRLFMLVRHCSTKR